MKLNTSWSRPTTRTSGEGLRRRARPAARASACVTVMRAIAGRRVPVGAYVDGSAAELERLEEWVSSVAAPSGVPVKAGIEFGHPSVEIPRFAEAMRRGRGPPSSDP